MSNFWDRAFGGAAPAAPAPAPQQPQYQPQYQQAPPQQSGPWWAAPQYNPQPQHPQYPNQYGPQQTVPQGYPNPEYEPEPESITEALHSRKMPKKAKVLRQTDTCPDCDSSNFFRPEGMPNAMQQCYDCGYNARFHQMTAGMPSQQGEASTPSKQIASGGARGRSNFNPKRIIDPRTGLA